jgi:transcriptional regulator of acetoin/glycerol metabolism
MPTPQNPELSALRLSDPAAFRARLRAALQAANGDIDDAAKLLRISRRTMFRWRSEANRATTDGGAST